ncbi:uncharacterized protein PV09_00076 [Verruconis gallopava]|uniref:alpha-1,2-Mannosidase n=1 Tax=Verruconis gallopava TaxID=253628 RepID=A0A0D2BCM5_9PEZI|nr:uncharacterized protein PV09_00076 [Verruconis gallopava]KIW09139.1 hypothetical protein PV09_00076 [Verruconis gallopava]
MLYTRRSTLTAVAISLLLFYLVANRRTVLPLSLLLRSPRIHLTWETCPNVPPSYPLGWSHKPTFDWRGIEIKNPVRSLTRLPTSRPSRIPRIQYPFAGGEEKRLIELDERREAVKKVFLRGWNTYRSKAWLHDELRPLSGYWKDNFGGWGATLFDNLDTLWIMGLDDEFEEAVYAAVDISLDPEDARENSINMFETTIRHLGGLLAAYDLTDCTYPQLLDKAMELGAMIYASYDTPNHMPVTRWRVHQYNQQQLVSENGIIAELASASLEFTRLSQLTGDMRYYDIVERITKLLAQQQSKTQLPGMFPIAVGTREEDLTKGETFSFGAMADSAFEYFSKTWQLLNGRDRRYQTLFEGAMNAASSHLLFRPSVPDHADILFSGNYHAVSGELDLQVQHLGCFTGGMYLLGGKLFGNASHLDIGRKLTNGCVWAYQNAPLGIMPEILQVPACPSFEPCEYDTENETRSAPFLRVLDARYNLRPEAVESVFYAYRITGDPRYQDVAWDMFQAIENNTATEFGNAAIQNVTDPAVTHIDSMESFWMSETLKYLYLIFSDPAYISLDEWVFNTEAHPFRLPRV